MLTELGIPKLWGEDPERCWGFARFLTRQAMRFLAPTAGYGLERMPPAGGAVVAANHFTELDPALIGIYSTRTIYYMAKIELLSMPIIGEALHWTGAFRVRRGESDRDALRTARWYAGHGHVVGMFMEGTRQHFGYPGPVHPGAAMIAIQEGVPVVPCGIDTFRWSPKNQRPCTVVWGEPVDLDGLPANGRGYKEGAAIIEGEIQRLWRLAAEAAAAGLPDRLSDGTVRGDWVRCGKAYRHPELPSWPTESWAESPLGPVYGTRP
jgi:1-acyl-sn-glycerol-3-phosphate acyltransferase